RAMVASAAAARPGLKAHAGLTDPELARGASLCALAIDGPLVIGDTLADPRFAAHPLVTDSPHVRFFAGVPLRTADDHAIGALCVMDVRPRALTAEQEVGLHAPARAAPRPVALRRRGVA